MIGKILTSLRRRTEVRVPKLIQAKLPSGVSGLGFPSRTLLVQWFVLNAVALVFLGTLAKFYGHKLHGAPLAGALTIIGIYLCGSLYGGKLCYDIEGASPLEKAFLLHKSQFLPFWAWLSQMAGILATLAGLEILLSGTTGNLHDRLLAGGGTVFISTFVGVFASVIITAIHRLIEHELEGFKR